MIPLFLLAQDLVVSWMTACMAPFEATYGRIGSELDRQRTNVSSGYEGASRHRPQRSPAAAKSIHCPEQSIRAADSNEICRPSRPERRGIASWLRRHLSWLQ